MKISIQTPHFKARQSLLGLVLEKVMKLEILSDTIIESQVFMKLDKNGKQENKICNIVLRVPGTTLFASSHSQSFEGAVVKAAEALRQQLERWKGRAKKQGFTSLAQA